MPSNIFLWPNIIADISIIYVVLFVVKMLPVLLIGKASKNKLIVAANKNKLSTQQTKQVRKLYLELAKIYHPDKSAEGEDDYERQKQMMTVINRAYEDQDLDTLKRISVESVDETELQNQTFAERKKHLTQQLNRATGSISDLLVEIKRIKSGETYQLKQEVNKAREEDIDLIANLVKGIQRKVNANQRKLAEIISIFQKLSARFQPMD